MRVAIREIDRQLIKLGLSSIYTTPTHILPKLGEFGHHVREGRMQLQQLSSQEQETLLSETLGYSHNLNLLARVVPLITKRKEYVIGESLSLDEVILVPAIIISYIIAYGNKKIVATPDGFLYGDKKLPNHILYSLPSWGLLLLLARAYPNYKILHSKGLIVLEQEEPYKVRAMLGSTGVFREVQVEYGNLKQTVTNVKLYELEHAVQNLIKTMQTESKLLDVKTGTKWEIRVYHKRVHYISEHTWGIATISYDKTQKQSIVTITIYEPETNQPLIKKIFAQFPYAQETKQEWGGKLRSITITFEIDIPPTELLELLDNLLY